MNAQTKIETLASAMAAAFAEIEAATKDARNPHFKSKYADLGAVIGAVKPALINHGLFVHQICHPTETGVTVETILGHCGGEEKSLGKLFVPADKLTPQGFGSALTYARRYAFQTAFVVPTEDDDGHASSKPRENGSALREQLQESVRQIEPIADEQRDIIQTLAPAAGKTVQDICGAYRVDSLKDLSSTQAANIINRLRASAKEPADA